MLSITKLYSTSYGSLQKPPEWKHHICFYSTIQRQNFPQSTQNQILNSILSSTSQPDANALKIGNMLSSPKNRYCKNSFPGPKGAQIFFYYNSFIHNILLPHFSTWVNVICSISLFWASYKYNFIRICVVTNTLGIN